MGAAWSQFPARPSDKNSSCSYCISRQCMWRHSLNLYKCYTRRIFLPCCYTVFSINQMRKLEPRVASGQEVIPTYTGFPGGSGVKNLPTMQETLGSIPGSGRSPGGGNGHLLRYSCLDNPMDRGAWQAMVHWITKSRTQLSH